MFRCRERKIRTISKYSELATRNRLVALIVFFKSSRPVSSGFLLVFFLLTNGGILITLSLPHMTALW